MNCFSLRCCVPICTMRPVFLQMSQSSRPSGMVNVIGFSQYTSFPASMASIAIFACQWSGVEIWTMSIFGLSKIAR